MSDTNAVVPPAPPPVTLSHDDFMALLKAAGQDVEKAPSKIVSGVKAVFRGIDAGAEALFAGGKAHWMDLLALIMSAAALSAQFMEQIKAAL